MTTSKASADGIRQFLDETWYVYLLKCSDGSYYAGCTSDIADRLTRHEKGYIKYTKSRLPIELITFTVFPNRNQAFKFEKYLKSGSGRAFAKRHFIE